MKDLVRDPWKKKESGARLSQRAAKEAAMGTIERRQMEEKASSPATVHVLYAGFHPPKTHRSFIVYLRDELPLEEIKARIAVAFGDLV